MNIKESQKIYEVSRGIDGIFSLGDLRVLYPDVSEPTLYRMIKDLQEAGVLVKLERGYYARPDADLKRVAMRLAPKGMLTGSTVLSLRGLIGTMPLRKVQIARVGSPKTLSTPLGVIDFLSMKPSLLFGGKMEDGLCFADPEKAYLDVWYFTMKGRSFVFDPDTDVNTDLLDWSKVEIYLQNYDERFQTYFTRRRVER